jgi:hypothetical protein
VSVRFLFVKELVYRKKLKEQLLLPRHGWLSVAAVLTWYKVVAYLGACYVPGTVINILSYLIFITILIQKS